MKILHVNHLLDPVTGGGTAERTFQLARFLTKRGAECAILTLDIGETNIYESKLEGVSVFKLPCLNYRYYIHITWPFRIRRLISEFDVVHLMGHWTLLNALVALSCIRQGKPYVVCPAGALKPFGRSRLLKKIYDVVVGRYIIRSAKGWVAITQAEKLDFTAYGVRADSIVVIPNGIDPEQYVEPTPAQRLTSITKLRLEEGAPYILFLGRLNAIKGPDLLLEAFIEIAKKFPDLHLVFAGPDSGLLLTLQNRASQSAVGQRVHFVGYLGGEEKVYALRKSLCLVIPSRNEAMSIVVLEAGMCGTPALFTDRCGLDDFAREGAGVMTEASAESIRDSLLQMLPDSNALRIRGERLSEIVREKFLWASQANRYYRHYQQILKGQTVFSHSTISLDKEINNKKN